MKALALLFRWIAFAQILRIYQDRASAEWIRHDLVRAAHPVTGPHPCVDRSWDQCYAWRVATEALLDELSDCVAWGVSPVVAADRLVRGRRGKHTSWIRAVAGDVLLRLAGHDVPLPEFEHLDPAPRGEAG
jgi:hypothetical protein